MDTLTERTFVLNFRALPGKLKYADVFDFIANKLGFDLSQVKHLQISNGKVYVGTESPQIAQNMVQEHNMKHEYSHDGKAYNIPLEMEDGSIEVRVHDLRPRTTHRMLAQRMREYGEILSIREETWKDHLPGIPNGVRILRMKLVKPIPSYVQVDTEMTLVTYRGQVATCKHCNRNVHYAQKCSEYAKSIKTSVNTRLTMAEAVKQNDTNDGFIEPRKKGRKTTSSLNALGKSHLINRSNISLADSEISVSSMEHMDTEFPALDGTHSANLDTSSAGETADSTPVAITGSSLQLSGSFDDESSHGGKQHSTMSQSAIQSTNTSTIKRPGSPLDADIKNTDKRQTRSQSSRSKNN